MPNKQTQSFNLQLSIFNLQLSTDRTFVTLKKNNSKNECAANLPTFHLKRQSASSEQIRVLPRPIMPLLSERWWA
jgi:hypothetical protein